MSSRFSQHGAISTRILSLWHAALAAGVLVCALGLPLLGRSSCPEEPTVWMNEATAESHLLAKRDLEGPAHFPELFLVRRVIVLVTVDREGGICAS